MAERDLPGAPPARRDGFVPIGDYAALGDGRTVALVARDGQVDWYPVPTLDSPPAFAAVLDPRAGGHLRMAPAGEFTVERRYLPGTNVLETTFHTTRGTVRVTDALTVGVAGRLPWGELVRRVEGVRGRVPMQWAVAPGNRFRSARPWVEERRGVPVLHVGDQHLAVRAFDVGEPTGDGHSVGGRFTATEGSDGLLAVVSTDREPLFLPEREAILRRLDRTVRSWTDWTSALTYDGGWADAVRRSALALKLMLFAPTGAIAAAPTTSLPERIGSDRNWDYRYAWVRDASFTLDALMELGLHEEVQGAVSWLLGALRGTAPDLHVFYKLDGRVPEGHEDLVVPGYRDSRPVRAGNGAQGQTQLGTFGDLFDTVWQYARGGHLLDPVTGRLLADLADRCCDLWRVPDAGIWELHQVRHYTISKIGCWVALDRAVRLVEAGQLPEANADRWRLERRDVKDWVDEHCWSEARGSYTFFAGGEELDAATLLAARTGFERGERLAGTVAAVRGELGRGPLLYRYSGMDDAEGAFLACSFWLVEALVALDRREEAAALMDECVGLANDVGLLAEEMDPENREMLGNFPQALTHLALVNAAVCFGRPIAPGEAP